MRRIVLAGVASGVGKTTIACALMAAYRRRGKTVQPFKAGPDYIDPSHHLIAAGRASRNLDSVLVPSEHICELFERATGSSDIAIVEGVMGLFDGRNQRGEEGSTAHIAKLVDAPVVVVIDVARSSRTAGAVALGCARFDPELHIAGFVLNRVASPAHAATATEAIESATGLPVLGAFPRDVELTLPERHLGLVPTAEVAPAAELVDRLAESGQRHLDLDRIWLLSEPGNRQPSPQPSPRGRGSSLFPDRTVPKRVTIAVAQDAAFNFYYQDNLDLLEAWGAEIALFSPLTDQQLPPETQAIYIGGGFPELFAEALTDNKPMLESLDRAARSGTPIYGECGGLMYLGRTLTDFEGRLHAMAGVLPLDSVMQRKRVTLGYRTARALRASPLLPKDAEIMGHEFHYSELAQPVCPETAAYTLAEKDSATEGYAQDNVLASYVHLHFGGNVDMVHRLIDTCARQQRLSC